LARPQDLRRGQPRPAGRWPYGRIPPGWSFKEIGGVGVDRNDNVFVFNRGEHPMIVFDREGNFLRSFGEGLFPRAHGVFMAPDDTVWLTDDGDHTVLLQPAPSPTVALPVFANRQRATTQTPEGLDATHDGALFPVN
jgi:hypothetical protein